MPDVPAVPVIPSIHRHVLRQTTPQWLIDSTAHRRAALKDADTPLPPAYWRATSEQRQQLHECFIASFTAQTALDKTMSGLQDIDAFARPLLVNALHDRYGITLAPHVATWLSLKKSLQVSFLKLEARTYDFLKLELVQAALHNFEEAEGEEGAFHSSSGFRWQVAPGDDLLLPVRLGNLKVHQFISLCRTLDIGGQYQTYIRGFFSSFETTLREQFIASQKTAMRAAAEMARICQDITEDDYTLVLSVINGERSPRMGGQPVQIRDLGMMKLRMTGCVLFLTFQDENVESFILYIPHDPVHPLKRYSNREQLLEVLKPRFLTPGAPSSRVGSPTAYQRFFSQFVDYADRPHYFSQFTQDAADATLREKIGANFPGITEAYELISKLTPFRLKNFPPLPVAPQVPNPDPYLAPIAMVFKGQVPGSDNIDLWTYLYEQHWDKCLADTAGHAVPTADVDARVRTQKLAMLLNIGVLGLNALAGFVPVLGEIMMAVMVEQLLTKTIEAVSEWQAGDRQTAKSYLIDLAENLALIGLTTVGGKVLGTLRPEPVIENLEPVALADGQVRLWKPDLSGYESLPSPRAIEPNALGQYKVDGKTYIRINNVFYEKVFDPTLNKWRIKHPQDPAAYQPLLEHNGAGAWRHHYERPLTWDRLTLLRRLGHITECFSDQTLGVIGDVSGVSDAVLRKVHVESLPVPAVLADTLEQFRVDQEVDELIARIRRGAGLNNRHEHVLPLTTQMPGWPPGRVLEVFEASAVGRRPQERLDLLQGEGRGRGLLGRLEGDEPGLPLTDEWGGGAEPAGHFVRYGSPLSADDARSPLKITRAQIRQGQFASALLAGLDEEDVTRLLGSASSWGEKPREQVFNERLADYAQQRQSSLFDALLPARVEPIIGSAPLQRRFPSLSHRARNELLSRASPRELIRLQDHARVGERLDHLARISQQQGRLSRAISGLYRERLANADSDRLALHALEGLAGWPQCVRLEVRLDSLRGPLIDSIGDERAAVRGYLVKRGDRFQAVDEAGRALNRVPAYGRNFFQSILHALPDPTLQALGLSLSREGGDLQQVLAAYARTHRKRVADEILKLRPPRSRPGLRLPSGHLGYALSGRGTRFETDERLIAHVRSTYPNLSESEAGALILARRRDGESNPQIWRLFSDRQREWLALRATLEQWAGLDEQRLHASADVIDCWRQGSDRNRAAHATLSLHDEQVLPSLQADFSHVRTLRLSGARLLAEPAAGPFQAFPNVQHLDLYITPNHLGEVTERLANVTGITQLSITGPSLTYSLQVLRPLERMPGLTQLSLAGRLQALDVTGLTGLRRLTVSGTLEAWPEGVLGLDHLESLDLAGTQWQTLPDAMFEGHERLWRGLRMNWSAFEPQGFMNVYEYLHDHPAHLVDEQGLVQAYCKGALTELRTADQVFTATVLDGFKRHGLTSRQRLERVNSVRKEYRLLVEGLEQWSGLESNSGPVEVERQVATDKLLECWHAGLQPRLLPEDMSTAAELASVRLDLSGTRLVDLPPLPASGFAHLRRLDLSDTAVSLEGLNGWIGQFSQLDTLCLARNNLTDLPSVLTQSPTLRHLDLSHNWLVITPTIQARLSQLTGLSSLRLQYNPIRSLDVSGLTGLRSLDLSHSALSEWPQGVFELPALGYLDLSHSAVSAIPEAGLSGDAPLLLNTHLRGCRLSVAARAEARIFARRHASDSLPEPLGIPRELLAQGLTGGEPEYFPEDVLRRPELLIALPATSSELSPAERLQHLDPALDNVQAQARIDELRNDGLDATQIQARLAEWEAQYQHWVRLLNDWIDVHGYLDGSGVSALDRRRAADRLLASWRYTLRAKPLVLGEEGAGLLDLSGLTLGDLPRLPTYFAHVSELDLSRIKLTAQGSNGFLQAFTHIETLTLRYNELRALPDALGEFRALRRLDVGSNALQSSPRFQQHLANWQALHWLNLSENVLNDVDVSGLSRLETLYLQRNMLDEWPGGVLELQRLRTLVLHDNWIETLPAQALEPQHRQLMAGTDLSDNRLDQASCERLQDYLAQTGNGLGFSADELEAMLDGHRESDDPWTTDSISSSLTHPEIETAQEQKDRWFSGVQQDSSKHRIWDDLSTQEGSADFFFSLSQLRNTADFMETPIELTQRVWSVLEAIEENPSLRQDIFARATALLHDQTCGDGRILIFNEFEIQVLGFNALKMAERGRDGAALLRFARGMIRLQAVEDIAHVTIENRPDIDPAEIRLALRMGLAERLELPRQPSGMRFRALAEVTQADLDSAYATVLQGEHTPGFDDKLVGLECWLNYLKNKYAAEFSALAREQDHKCDSLDADAPGYYGEFVALDVWSKAQRKALALRLTRKEREALGI